MQVVILAGGFGTRISEESIIKPKPLIEIGGTPILIHLMRFFYKQGYTDFIICGGYKCDYIKEYFYKYNIINSDFTIDNKDEKNKFYINNSKSEKWKVTVINTGKETQTGGRIKRVKEYITSDNFFMTYGDGLSDVDLTKVLEKYNESKSIVTLTSVQRESKFGVLEFDGTNISTFAEKTMSGGGWINAGFMILNKEIFNYIDGDDSSFEFDVLPKLAKINKLTGYKHCGFWKCMDTLKDKNEFEEIVMSGNIPWKK
ncbi:MAG: glucose-1-phosphate cytidylyltransferase [Mycoplasma sp.]